MSHSCASFLVLREKHLTCQATIFPYKSGHLITGKLISTYINTWHDPWGWTEKERPGDLLQSLLSRIHADIDTSSSFMYSRECRFIKIGECQTDTKSHPCGSCRLCNPQSCGKPLNSSTSSYIFSGGMLYAALWSIHVTFSQTSRVRLK